MNTEYYKKYEPIFGSWYITEKIGEGAFGSVFVIERKDLGVTYRSALKAITIPQDKSEIKSVMSDGMSKDEATEYYRNLVQSIVNEFILMSKLKGNSHVVSYEDHIVFEHEDEIGWDVMIRMELLTPLVDLTSQNTMGESEIIKLGISLCKALAFCRKYNIIHRDIKPENIFIAPSGDYKLGDFGIAKTVEKTRIGLSRKGTYAYMAPEIYRGDAYGATVDIYSLGIVLYKLLNDNRTPFMPEYPSVITPEAREAALAKRLSGRDIPEPANGSPELKRIVLKACEFRAENRFQSAEQMQLELESLLLGTTVAKYPKHKSIKSKSNIIKKKFVYSAASLVAIMCLFSGIIAVRGVTDITGVEKETVIYIGEEYQNEYKATPWLFSNKEIAINGFDDKIISVDERGNIVAVGVGKTKMTISAGEYSEQANVTVLPKVTKISNVEDEIRIEKGEHISLQPELFPKEFADEKITYTLEDEAIAGIDGKGNLTGKQNGETILTISAGGCQKKVTITVYTYTAPVVRSNSRSTNSDGFFSNSDDEFF